MQDEGDSDRHQALPHPPEGANYASLGSVRRRASTEPVWPSNMADLYGPTPSDRNLLGNVSETQLVEIAQRVDRDPSLRVDD